jgi:DNA-binding transcriptional LysR family regulator
MPLSRSELADFGYFLAVAKHRNFRLAGLELGVSASAVSHALKGLETRLGVRLINRTNRSVTLTAAGEELHAAIAQPIDAIGTAVENLNRYRDAPAGRIRLNVVVNAVPLILGPVLPVFMDRYPDIEVEIVATDRMVDVVGGGFDAGIRHGGTVPEDMIAQRLSADLHWAVAASPAYLARFGTPEHPADLQRHRCLGVRLGDDRIYRWEFMGPDGEFAVSVPSRIIVNEGRAMLALALQGAGLMYNAAPVFAPHVEDGQLRLVLERWSTSSPGYHIYYSSRRQVPAGLRLLVELIREMRPLGL